MITHLYLLNYSLAKGSSSLVPLVSYKVHIMSIKNIPDNYLF